MSSKAGLDERKAGVEQGRQDWLDRKEPARLGAEVGQKRGKWGFLEAFREVAAQDKEGGLENDWRRIGVNNRPALIFVDFRGVQSQWKVFQKTWNRWNC